MLSLILLIQLVSQPAVLDALTEEAARQATTTLLYVQPQASDDWAVPLLLPR